MAKLKAIYICSECGFETSKWSGRCSSCKSYNTLNEEVVEVKSKTVSVSQTRSSPVFTSLTLKKLSAVENSMDERTSTNISELDRVLSGGIVTGSLTLVGGEPGIGKSTLLLQISQSMKFTGENQNILYISGEESMTQIKMRAERLGITTENLYLLSETNVQSIEGAINQITPKLVIIDSIQTMYLDELSSAPGSVTQVRECTSFFMRLAKGNGISVIIIGHVTKEGAIAGPRVLEHMVDTVLYFEGERRASYRIIRAVKNRFGATDEIGVFEMNERGLSGISNPSEYMLSGRPLNAPGSVVTCSMEGTRPILTEVQSLICYTNFGTPRRVATGLDYNRVVMLIAMLEKRAGLQMSNYDSYVNIAGGMKIAEPAIDLATVAAVVSSFKNKAIDPYFIAFGEVGLTGEVRAVAMAEKRVQEAEKLGFTECAIPQANMKGLRSQKNIRVYGISNVNEMLNLIIG